MKEHRRKIRKRIETPYNGGNGKKIGRPSKYDPDRFPKLAEHACGEMGATDEQLAQLMDTTVQSIFNWEHQHQEFFEAIKRGQDRWNNRRSKKSLAQRANGYYYDEVKTEEVKLRGKKGKITVWLPAIKTTTVRKHIPPDPSCLFFLLSNKLPDEFKNTKYVDIKGSTKKTVTHQFKLNELKKVPTEQLENLSLILADMQEEIPSKEKLH